MYAMTLSCEQICKTAMYHRNVKFKNYFLKSLNRKLFNFLKMCFAISCKSFKIHSMIGTFIYMLLILGMCTNACLSLVTTFYVSSR